MINIIEKESYQELSEFPNYTLKCPRCGSIMSFGKDDVYKDEDCCYVHHEYLDCPVCNKKVQLDDEHYYGY